MLKIQELISKLLELSKNKYYEQMLILLKEHQNYKQSENGKLIFTLLNDIVRIKKHKKTPKQTNRKSNNYKNAIEYSNYSLALELCKSIKKPYNAKEINILKILLTNINKLIEDIKEEQQIIIEKERNIREEKIQEINNLLISNEIDKAKQLISEFLTEIDQQEYIFLINKLIEISNLKEDKDYIEVIEILKQISLSTTIVDFKSIIGKLNESINFGRIKEANIYFAIINNYYEIIPDKITKKELNHIKTLLTQYNAIEVFLNQTKTSLENKGLYVTRLDNITKKDDFLKVAHNIPGIIVREISNNKGNSLLLIIRNKSKEITKLLNQLIKIYDIDTIIKIFNDVGTILSNKEKDHLKQIAYYIIDNNISFKYVKTLFSLTDREVQIIKLLALEIYYTEGNYTRGNELIISMSYIKNLDKELLSLITYIKDNKDTYKNTINFSKRLVRLKKQSNE